ncbi:MAG: aromatic ring-hydroxylating dioxygenase subunit alpha [Pseudomonadota bacterium]
MTRTLPAAWYTDPAILQRERETIFRDNWALFGPEHDVAEPGSWRADTVAGWPLVVVRHPDGHLNGFHNVCRHRAAALLSDGQTGQCSAIRCPYHGWTYDLDGSLKLTPKFGDPDGFSRDVFGLFPVRVAVWAGLVFVCLSNDAPDLTTWLGDVPDLAAPYPTTDDLDYHGSFVVDGPANWKTYCDNTVEGYHLPFVHQRLTKIVDQTETAIRSYQNGHLVVFHVGYHGLDTGVRGGGGIWFYRVPGFQAVLGPTGFKAERIDPVGPGALRSTSWAWYGGLDDKARADAFAWAETIVREDLGICQTVQQNLEAGIYDTGILSPKMETHTARLQQIVRDYVETPAAAADR